MQKILIVDDSASIREEILAILSPLAECHVATNGREAVDLIKRTQGKGNNFELVIMDVIMPEKDGLTAVKEIRAFEKEQGWSGDDTLTIIIATTIKDPARILIAQYECGADAYIAKPFTEKTVLQTLRNNGLIMSTGTNDIVDNQNQWNFSE
jgi:two-component system, chemotaxis family, chemotaxis protein CheY